MILNGWFNDARSFIMVFRCIYFVCIIYHFDICLIFVGICNPTGDPYPHAYVYEYGVNLYLLMYMDDPTELFFLSCIWI